MKKKILMVEDEVLLAMAKRQELARYNYETSHVTTGEKALDLICQGNEPIDLILMDIDLGRGIDGTEAARQILEYKEVPIVFLSSHEEPEIVEKTEKITSYGYVVKSSSITVLDASIKMAFKLYESRIREREKDKKLRINEERLSLAMDAAEHGFWDWNITTGDVYFSPRYYTMLGYEPGELPMRFDTWVDLLHPDSKDVIDHINQHVKNAEPFTEEFQLRCKDGSYKWISGQGKSYEFNEEGQPTRVVGVHVDITEKRKSEEALRLSEGLLTETGKMVRTGGWEVDVDSQTVYWTKATKMIYEVPESYEPTIERAMTYFPGESGERLREAYKRSVEEGVDYDLELDFITAKGNKLKVRDIGRAVFKDGKCHKVYGVFQDITEKKRTEESLVESREKYRRLNNNLPFLLMEVDIDTQEIVSCNTALSESLGLLPEDVEGKFLEELLPEDVLNKRVEYGLKAFEEDKIQTFDDERDDNFFHHIFIPVLTNGRRLVQTITTNVTDLRVAQKELQDSLNILHHITDNMHDMVAQITKEGDITYVSPSHERVLGYESEFGIGRNMMEFVHPDDREATIAAITETVRSQSPKSYELRLRSISGEYIWVESIGKVLKDDVGEITGMIISTRDISERKNVEQALEVSEKHFKAFMNYFPGAAFINNKEKQLLYCNKQFSQMLNKSPEEIIGTYVCENVDPEVEKVYEQENIEVIENGRLLKSESVFPYDGKNTYWLTYKFPIEVETERFLGAISIDITDRKKVEEKVQKSEQKFRDFSNSITDIYFAMDNDLNYTFWNKACEIQLGHKKEEIIGKNWSSFDFNKGSDWIADKYKKAIATKKSEKFESLFEQSGKKLYLLTYVYPTSSGLVVYSQNITERKLAEEELRLSLKEKDFLMKELNHRVKNSLLMISSLISLKNSETDPNLSDIQHQIEAISLIHEKLYQTESVTEINCKDYFWDLLISLFSSFTKQEVKVEIFIEDIIIQTKTAMTLGLIINEIATNAIKHGFTDKEEAVFSMTMEKDKKNSQHKIILSNSGKPFPEDVDIESTDTLGLRLINALVAQLDGTVELQRTPHPMFTIKIPIED